MQLWFVLVYKSISASSNFPLSCSQICLRMEIHSVKSRKCWSWQDIIVKINIPLMQQVKSPLSYSKLFTKPPLPVVSLPAISQTWLPRRGVQKLWCKDIYPSISCSKLTLLPSLWIKMNICGINTYVVL